MARGFDVQITLKAARPFARRPAVKRTVTRILKALGWKGASLSLLIVGDPEMKRLNKRFLGHDYATDVISFSGIEGKKVKAGDGRPFLGDMIVSVDTAKRQAAEYGNTPAYEFAFYLCHGILHLMGMDDKTPRLAKQMERKQTMILKKIGVKGRGK